MVCCLSVTSGVVFRRDFLHSSLSVFGEQTVSLCSRIVQDQVQFLVGSGNVKPFFVSRFSCRDELDHGVCTSGFSHCSVLVLG